MKKKILVSAILSIALCVSLIAGATFALFTSESKVNIAVTSGKVKVTATIDETSVKTKQLYDTDYTAGKDHTYQGEFTFDENGLKLDKFLPGDGVKFDIVIKNESNVTVQYRTKWYTANDNGLLDGLTVTVDGVAYAGYTVFGNWATFDGIEKKVTVEVTLDESKGNEYQDKTCTLSFLVEAVQGNADTSNVPVNELEIFNAYDLRAFAKLVNAGKLDSAYTEIKLMDDIDLNGEAWTSVMAGGANRSFTFNGNGKTIKNLVVSGDKNVGLFGTASSCVIKNLTVDGAEVNGINHVGVIAGDALCTTIENCTVKNAKVATSVKNMDDGDKAGAIAGYLSAEPNASVKNCSVINCEVKGYRDVGSVIGYANAPYEGSVLTVTGNSASGVKLINDRTVNYKKYKEDSKFDVNEIVGEYGNGGTIDNSGNTASGITGIDLIAPEDVGTNDIKTDGAVIAGAGKDITEVDMSGNKISADNVTIKDMTINGSGSEGTKGTLNINGANTTIENVDYVGDGNIAVSVSTGAANSGTTFRGTKITNAFRGIQFWSLSGDSLIEDCVIDVAGYTFNVDAVVAGSTLTIKNSVLNGWTSYTNGIKLVTFDNCKLGLNTYEFLRPYSETIIKNCEFTSADYQLNAGGIGEYTITIENCTKNGVKVTAENIKTLLLDMDGWNANATLIVDGVTVNFD